MKEILLTRGKVALVDDDDYERVSQHKWFAMPNGPTFRAARTVQVGNGRQKTVWLHRFILDAPNGVLVDHKSGDGLDCRRENLRYASTVENNRNQAKRKDNRSGYKGVAFITERRKWGAYIGLNNKTKKLGYFDDPVSAAHAYDAAAKQYFGDFARLNFPEPPQ